MLPFEITAINDSDFDIDKEYVIRKELPVYTRPKEDIITDIIEKIKQDYPTQDIDEIEVFIRKLVSNP